jgi:hypothetical protein
MSWRAAAGGLSRHACEVPDPSFDQKIFSAGPNSETLLRHIRLVAPYGVVMGFFLGVVAGGELTACSRGTHESHIPASVVIHRSGTTDRIQAAAVASNISV